MLNQIIQGDCYELMKGIPDGSIDLVLTDPPYNTTLISWDKQPIDLVELWRHFKRILKPGGAVISTASQPFTTDLISSNKVWFKYCLVWDKVSGSNFTLANVMPLKTHEDIVIFGKGKITYNPQKFKRDKPKDYTRAKTSKASLKSEHKNFNSAEWTGNKVLIENFPGSILFFPCQSAECNNTNREHPTQKPIELFSYLTRTYTNPGETVLDPFAGSGTTALAAHATGRQFLCFEKEPKYVEIANKRLALAQMQGRFEEMVG